MSEQIFISYRREGGDVYAYLLHEKLKAEGYTVFWDLESLGAGKYDEKLDGGIENCDDALILITPNSFDRHTNKNDDDWFVHEIEKAINKGKNIIPIVTNGGSLEKIKLPDKISDLKKYQSVNLLSIKDFETKFKEIKKNLSPKKKPSLWSGFDKTQKHIIIWGDIGEVILKNISKKLNLGNEYDFKILDDPQKLSYYNLSEADAIILIITDCTKLSNNDDTREKINQDLADYVEQGGKLIGTHDIIYRRTRNEKLQEIYSCKINNFKRIDKIKYNKTDECAEDGYFSNLAESFYLTDGEICWGDIEGDVKIYFETSEETDADGKPIPLVFSCKYGNGLCIYLNSGDFNEKAPVSIRKLENPFVELLKESILLKNKD